MGHLLLEQVRHLVDPEGKTKCTLAHCSVLVRVNRCDGKVLKGPMRRDRGHEQCTRAHGLTETLWELGHLVPVHSRGF